MDTQTTEACTNPAPRESPNDKPKTERYHSPQTNVKPFTYTPVCVGCRENSSFVFASGCEGCRERMRLLGRSPRS